MKKKGLFVTFEGIEGCGKTTQSSMLAKHLHEDGYSVYKTHEPGGCPISDQIRAVLLNGENIAMVPRAEIFLYMASRAQHVEQIIKPALTEGHIVLCDRFDDSTYAYQVAARGLSNDVFCRLNDYATDGLAPDITFLLNLPVEIGLKRARGRNGADISEARFEMEQIDFHERVHHGFLRLAEAHYKRFCIIDATGTIEQIHFNIYDKLKELL